MKINEYFEDILDANQILTGDDLDAYPLDRTGLTTSVASLVLLPKTVDDVSAILKRCYEQEINVIPAGGRTGLSGATVSLNDEVIISLEKMNKIIDVDTIGATISVESGAILEDVQNEAEKQGMYFPLDFAAKGSCMIGGCLSTNAGGVKVIKYGMTRQFVLGLEVVLADGRILDLNKALVKDNSGYDLKQFFIGAEGTLGIITKATFQCSSIPKDKELVLLSVNSFSLIPEIFQKMKASSLDCLAFEFITDIGMKAVLNAMPQIKMPFEDHNEYFVLIEMNEANRDKIQNFIEKLADEELIDDAVFAENSTMFNDFWTIREAVSDSLYLLGKVHANDVSVPIKALTNFVSDLDRLIKDDYQDFTLGLFGHIGDGNFHIYIIDEANKAASEFNALLSSLDKAMFQLVQKYNGSISAEHGIGLYKKDALPFQKSDAELLYAKKIKALFDGKGILNPGKVVV